MCILFVAKNVHADFPLLIVANRDEFFDRPSKGIHYWKDQPEILAGRDQLAGGSWLGINRAGRIAGVTNLRAPELRQAGAKSRGELVSRWLTGRDTLAEFEYFLDEDYREYNPFNLLYGDVASLYLFSSSSAASQKIAKGFFGVSNGDPSDQWPKMSRGVALLEEYIAGVPVPDAANLMELMRDNTRVDWSSLGHSGIPVDYEEALSSIFVDAIEIRENIYGTRTTSVLAFDRESVVFTEWDYDQDGSIASAREEHLELNTMSGGAS
jgi:uncharacterized protein with NRDE domain